MWKHTEKKTKLWTIPWRLLLLWLGDVLATVMLHRQVCHLGWEHWAAPPPQEPSTSLHRNILKFAIVSIVLVMVPALMLAVLCSTVGVAFKRIQKDVKPLNFIEFSCAIFWPEKKIWRRQRNAWSPEGSQCRDILQVGTQLRLLRLQLQIHPTLLAEACRPGEHRQRLRTTAGRLRDYQ